MNMKRLGTEFLATGTRLAMALVVSFLVLFVLQSWRSGSSLHQLIGFGAGAYSDPSESRAEAPSQTATAEKPHKLDTGAANSWSEQALQSEVDEQMDARTVVAIAQQIEDLQDQLSELVADLADARNKVSDLEGARDKLQAKLSERRARLVQLASTQAKVADDRSNGTDSREGAVAPSGALQPLLNDDDADSMLPAPTPEWPLVLSSGASVASASEQTQAAATVIERYLASGEFDEDFHIRIAGVVNSLYLLDLRPLGSVKRQSLNEKLKALNRALNNRMVEHLARLSESNPGAAQALLDRFRLEAHLSDRSWLLGLEQRRQIQDLGLAI